MSAVSLDQLYKWEWPEGFLHGAKVRLIVKGWEGRITDLISPTHDGDHPIVVVRLETGERLYASISALQVHGVDYVTGKFRTRRPS